MLLQYTKVAESRYTFKAVEREFEGKEVTFYKKPEWIKPGGLIEISWMNATSNKVLIPEMIKRYRRPEEILICTGMRYVRNENGLVIAREYYFKGRMIRDEETGERIEADSGFCTKKIIDPICDGPIIYDDEAIEYEEGGIIKLIPINSEPFERDENLSLPEGGMEI